jgi:hypothetical protein
MAGFRYGSLNSILKIFLSIGLITGKLFIDAPFL